MRTLTPAEAQRFYNWFGRGQDANAIYEDRATHILREHGRFPEAEQVVELGCGTGRFAAAVLADSPCRYLGLDVSHTMVRHARERLGAFSLRAEVRLTDGRVALPVEEGGADRVVANYVLDLLGEADIAAFFDEAERVLRPGGLVCVASLTTGERRLSRAVTAAWQRVFALQPMLLGGCRPVALRERLDGRRLRVEHHAIVERFGLASEVVVAARE